MIMAQNDFTAESAVFPLNENGEIVFTTGSGSTNIVGFVNSSQIPSDPRTGRVKAVFGAASVETATVGNELTYYIKEGSSAKFTSNSAVGTITKYKSDGSIDFAIPVISSTVVTFGKYVGTQKFVVSCTSGSMDVSVANSVLSISASPQISTAGASNPFTAQGIGAFSAVTIVNQMPALGPFYSFQLIYVNKTSAAITITSAKAAASPTHQNDGTGLTWSQVTFGGSTSGVIPTGTQPAGGDNNDWVPGILVSDTIYVSYVARTDDTSKLPLVQARTWFAGSGSTLQVAPNVVSNYNASVVAAGGQYAGATAVTDIVSTITAKIPTEAGVFIQPVSAKFNYANKAFSLACPGDSLTAGKGSTSDVLGWPQRLQGLRTGRAGTLLTVANYGWVGQHRTASFQTAKQIITAYKPNAITAHAWSPNDTAATPAIMDKCFAELLELIEFGRQNGVRVIPVTSGPLNSNTAPQDALVKAQNDRVRALGTFILDFAPIIEDPSDRTKILPAYNSGDGIHYTDACYAALATYADAIISAIIP
jgi:hypothetical protein